MRAWLIFLAVCFCSMFMGVWLGEDLSAGPFDYIIYAAGALVWFLASILVAWRKKNIWAKSAMVGIFIPAALLVGLYAGTRISVQAFNECVHNGEAVRAALSEYFDENGRYPEDLNSLKMKDLPGDRLLRGNILHYMGSDEGYELHFGDWLVSHNATESEPFMPYK